MSKFMLAEKKKKDRIPQMLALSHSSCDECDPGGGRPTLERP